MERRKSSFNNINGAWKNGRKRNCPVQASSQPLRWAQSECPAQSNLTRWKHRNGTNPCAQWPFPTQFSDLNACVPSLELFPCWLGSLQKSILQYQQKIYHSSAMMPFGDAIASNSVVNPESFQLGSGNSQGHHTFQTSRFLMLSNAIASLYWICKDICCMIHPLVLLVMDWTSSQSWMQWWADVWWCAGRRRPVGVSALPNISASTVSTTCFSEPVHARHCSSVSSMSR